MPDQTAARDDWAWSGESDASAASSVALRQFRGTVDSYRSQLLNCDWGRDPVMRARALYFVQSLEVAAFNNYVAPRQTFPALYVQSMFMPFELTWGIQNPDFLNRNGYIDGARSYRIHGRKNGCYWSTIQVFRGFWGDDLQGTLANIDFDDVPHDEDGNFEIFLGPECLARAEGKYFVRTDPASRNMLLAMRETCWDWTRETLMDVHIEILDRPDDEPLYYDEEEFARRIAKAGKFLAACCENVLGRVRELGPGGTMPPNRFVEAAGGHAGGGSPLGAWVRMVYDIQPDEALIIDMPVVEARYWGIQLGSVWMQTTDFSYHQSSLNGHQAAIDTDGRFRAVLSAHDPGVPNWLDPVGHSCGMAVLRFYKFETIAVPEVTKVKFDDLRTHLPADTPVVTAQDRITGLETRRTASLRRYGQ